MVLALVFSQVMKTVSVVLISKTALRQKNIYSILCHYDTLPQKIGKIHFGFGFNPFPNYKDNFCCFEIKKVCLSTSKDFTPLNPKISLRLELFKRFKNFDHS